MDLLGMTGANRPFDSQFTDGLQVLRYNQSQAYIPHVDYLEDNGSGHDYNSSREGSNRFATVFFYLSDVEEGGETVFAHGQAVDDGEVGVLDGVTLRQPQESKQQVLQQMRSKTFYSQASQPRRLNNGSLVAGGVEGQLGPSEVDPLTLFEQGSWEQDMLGMCRSKLAVRPKKAHAMLFYSQHPDGQLDPLSKHGGCPVLKGTKWAANLWIWNKVRLGYPRAPRKEGASAFDASKGIGRDRMKGESQKAAAAPPPTQLTVEFSNADLGSGAKLFYGGDDSTAFMGDLLPGGAALRFNTFQGHQWVIKDASGNIVGRYQVDARPTQSFRVSSAAAAGGGGGSGGGGAGGAGGPALPPRPPVARPPA